MTLGLHVGALLAGLSGVAIAVLGAVVLAVRPRSRAGWAFGAFAALWGAQVVAANVARASVDPGEALAWQHAFVALTVPLYVPLLALVAVHPFRAAGARRRRALLVLAAAPAALGLAALAAAPGLYVGPAAARADGFLAIAPGPAFLPVLTANTTLAFAAALWVLQRKLPLARSAMAREQVHLLSLALLPYLGYRGGQIVAHQVLFAPAFLPAQGAPVFLLLLAMGAACLAAVAGAVVGARRDPSHPHARAAVAFAAVPLGVAVLEALLRRGGALPPDTLGLWRLLTVATLALGIARYRLFDVHLRWSRPAAIGAFLAVSLSGFQVMWDVFGPVGGASPTLALAAAVGFELMVVAVSLRLHRRWPAVAGGGAGDGDARSLRVYQAALEGALEDGVVTPREDGVLRALRRELGVSEEQHARLLAQAAGAPAPRAAARRLTA